jgi:hypothetical protein
LEDTKGVRACHVFLDRFGDAGFRIERPWRSVGTVKVSAGAIVGERDVYAKGCEQLNTVHEDKLS